MHEHVEILIKAAAQAATPLDAMQFSQAAQNCANALRQLADINTQG